MAEDFFQFLDDVVRHKRNQIFLVAEALFLFSSQLEIRLQIVLHRFLDLIRTDFFLLQFPVACIHFPINGAFARRAADFRNGIVGRKILDRLSVRPFVFRPHLTVVRIAEQTRPDVIRQIIAADFQIIFFDCQETGIAFRESDPDIRFELPDVQFAFVMQKSFQRILAEIHRHSQLVDFLLDEGIEQLMAFLDRPFPQTRQIDDDRQSADECFQKCVLLLRRSADDQDIGMVILFGFAERPENTAVDVGEQHLLPFDRQPVDFIQK